MKKIVVTVETEEEMEELRFYIPSAICERIDRKQLHSGIEKIFKDTVYSIHSIEEAEEVRHSMGRRWDDAPRQEEVKAVNQ